MATEHTTPHVTWDEETIALHDTERGTRMKIEEPKTPYHYYGSDGEDHTAEKATLGVVSPARSLSGKEDAPPIEWSELQLKLQNVQQQRPALPVQSEWDSSDDESVRSKGSATTSPFAARDAEGKKIEKDPKFTDKRKSHYNEYQQMKMWRQSHPSDDEDDEAEEKTTSA